MTVGTLSVLAASRAVNRLVPQVVEGVEGGVGQRPDRPTISSIASGRAPTGYELLSSKGDAAVSPVARLDPDFRRVNKHRGSYQPSAFSHRLGVESGGLAES